jgi:hypothetical protein
VSRQRIPDEVLSAAHARARAREASDWAEADRLRTEIEAAGWKIVDRGTDFALSPARPPDVTEGDQVRYGSSLSVPSRLAEPSVGLATIVLVATDRPDDLDRALAGISRSSPPGTTVVIVGNGPSAAQDAALDAIEAAEAAEAAAPHDAPDAPPTPRIEVVRTSERLDAGAALNVGLRRASGPVVIVLAATVETTGDIVGPLVRALDDPTVAVAGGWGLRSGDLRRFDDAPPGEADAIDGSLLAFRRSDAAERGPIDERFRTDRWLAVWWSLVLRDEGEDGQHRRAVALAGIPAVRHERGSASGGETGQVDDTGDAQRAAKRDFYRIVDRFGWRRDLLVGGPPSR